MKYFVKKIAIDSFRMAPALLIFYLTLVVVGAIQSTLLQFLVFVSMYFGLTWLFVIICYAVAYATRYFGNYK